MDQAEYRKLKFLLEPCRNPEELDNFIQGYLKISLPWDIVDEDSTASSLSFLWQAYSFLLTGKGPSKFIVAASRNSAKTLTASIFQFLSLLHFRRDGIHLAALLSQASAMTDYLDNYLKIEELAPYLGVNNFRKKTLVGLPDNDLVSRESATLRIVTASKKGTNAPRASCLSFDEVELVEPNILAEAAFIADPARTGPSREPLFLYLSSRKMSNGPMQALIDSAVAPNARERGLALMRWSAVDWMKRCPDEVSLRNGSPRKAFLNMEDLSAIWDKEMFDFTVSESNKSLYKEIDCFEGCQTCPAFIACQGRSVKQRGDSSMLRTREFVGNVLEAVKSPDAIIAQTLNLKPEQTAMVFKGFSWTRHVGDFNRFYEFISGGEPYNPAKLTEEEVEDILENGTKKQSSLLIPTKEDIYKKMREVGWRINFGIDWGYSPAPATVVVTGFHMKWRKACVLHVDGAKFYANNDWASYVAEKVWSLFPGDCVCPDMADRANNVYWKKLRLPCIDTKPSRIETGVSQIRGLLWNPMTKSSSFMILDDGIEKGWNHEMIKSFESWTHKKTPMGYDFEAFTDDDFCNQLDPLRYALAPFIEKRESTMGTGAPILTPRESAIKDLEDKFAQSRAEQQKTVKDVFRDTVLKEMGLSIDLGDPKPVTTDPNRKKLKFSF